MVLHQTFSLQKVSTRCCTHPEVISQAVERQFQADEPPWARESGAGEREATVLSPSTLLLLASPDISQVVPAQVQARQARAAAQYRR